MHTLQHDPNGLRRLGGAAALYLAVAYLAAVVYFLVIVDFPSLVDPRDKVDLFARHLTGLQLAYLAIYVVFGVVLMTLAWALHDRLASAAPATMRFATGIALVWGGLLIASGMAMNAGMETVVALHGTDPAGAATVWLAVESVTSGMSGGKGELLGGLWTLLVSWAAWRSRRLPRALNVVGALAGAAGVASTVPGLGDLVAVFGLTQLVWFVWLGVVLLRRPAGQVDTADAMQATNVHSGMFARHAIAKGPPPESPAARKQPLSSASANAVASHGASANVRFDRDGDRPQPGR